MCLQTFENKLHIILHVHWILEYNNLSIENKIIMNKNIRTGMAYGLPVLIKGNVSN